jgi:dTDP-4-dehydrorhamnose 3,5-epimerase
MQVTPQAFPEVLLIEPKMFRDRRGHFLEIFQARRYPEHGIPPDFVQDNVSFSLQGTVRALHYQLRFPQGKLVITLAGEIWDVVVDIRRGSPTFGKHLPPGFAHGFAAVSEMATVLYKCTDYYHPEDECGLIWNDPDLGIAWPVATPLLSDKDQSLPRLKDLPPDKLPVYR